MKPFDAVGDTFMIPLRFPRQIVEEVREVGNTFPLALFDKKATHDVRVRFRSDCEKLCKNKVGEDIDDYVLDGRTKRAKVYVEDGNSYSKEYMPPFDYNVFLKTPLRCIIAGTTGSGKTVALQRLIQKISVVEHKVNTFPTMLIFDPQGQLYKMNINNKLVIHSEEKYAKTRNYFKVLSGDSGGMLSFRGKEMSFLEFGKEVSRHVIYDGFNVVLSFHASMNEDHNIRNLFVCEVVKGFLSMLQEEWERRGGDDSSDILESYLLVMDEYLMLKTPQLDKQTEYYATEARKYHGGFLFASQNPKDYPERVLSSADVKFIGSFNTVEDFELVRTKIYPKMKFHPREYVKYLQLIPDTCRTGVFFLLQPDKTVSLDKNAVEDFGAVSFLMYHKTADFLKGIKQKDMPKF